MKHNLKEAINMATRTECEECHQREKYLLEMDEELQQLKQELNRKNVVYEDEESKIYDKAQSNLINEILGENREKEWLPHREPIEFKKKGEKPKMTEVAETLISSQWSIRVPVAVRPWLQVKPGDLLVWVVVDGRVKVKKKG